MDAKTIIIGAGCAGMQLMHSLLQLPYEITGDIILIEKCIDIPQKSWCFWTAGNTNYDFLISKKWPKAQFSAPGINLVEPIAPYQYNYINSEHFFDYHYQLIKDSARVKLIYESVTHIAKDHDIYTVYTNRNNYQSTRVYNSNLEYNSIFSNQNILLWQHFKGWFIKTDKPVFATDTATLMDFNLPQNADGANFIYVLPFSANEALIEFTSFSKLTFYPDQVYKEYLSGYIKDKWEADFEIQKEESGKIPMTDFPFEPALKNGIINIGSAAGCIKPTTGYAFNRIRRDTQNIIQTLRAGTQRVPLSNSRYRFYDKLLLQIIKNEPEKVQQIMAKLFSKNDWLSVLRFLDEDSTFAEEIAIFSTLPKRLFLKQVYQHVCA